MDAGRDAAMVLYRSILDEGAEALNYLAAPGHRLIQIL